jgi:flagellar protein FliO/FliZ
MDLWSVAKMAAALAMTLALIGALAYAVRRFGMVELRAPNASRRLRVVETLYLDPRRRLVLVRCDDAEHLLLLSAAGDRAIATTPAKTVETAP